MHKLNILNNNGDVIGEETREEIHRQGLLHQEIHVWIYTPDGKLVFQHRAKDKDTYPDLLDASVGGHVEVGQTPEEASVMEVEEETGLKVSSTDLTYITTTQSKSFDQVTKMTNNARRNVYALKFEGNIDDLQVEEGKALGFEAWGIDQIMNLSEQDKARFIPGILNEETFSIFSKIKNLL